VTALPTNLRLPDLVDPLWPSPQDLTVIPRMISGDDPEAETKRAEWRRWKVGVLAYRTARWFACGETVDGATGLPLKVVSEDQEVIAGNRRIELDRCKRDPAYFLTVWCAIK
jgi:hypothetical protein